MTDATSQLRSATRRAKSDVANKLISMFLHDLSRRISHTWEIRVDSEEYADLVRKRFDNRCPYCGRGLSDTQCVIEHLDGMNRYRVGLHIPGNVLVACKICNSEKRRDDSLKVLSLAGSGWESFLSHDGSRCAPSCRTCSYWVTIWPAEYERKSNLQTTTERIRSFRAQFPQSERMISLLSEALPTLLTKLYSDCQDFAEKEIGALLKRFEEIEAARDDVPTN
ncbi:MAG: HNH endonuclease signature motif containing protein [Acidobacteriaceae bacterium]